MVKWVHEFLQMRRDRKSSIEREVWARLVNKNARLPCFLGSARAAVVRVVFDNTFWLGSGIFFALEGFPHFKQVFHSFSAYIVALKTVFHVKHCFFYKLMFVCRNSAGEKACFGLFEEVFVFVSCWRSGACVQK